MSTRPRSAGDILPPIVTSLPASGTRYHGMQVYFRHTSGQPPILMMWDETVNSGSWITVNQTPPGTVSFYTGAANTAPFGWVIANGQTLSKTTYPFLFDVIGYHYGGAGDNFDVPNLVDKVPIGAGGTYSINQANVGSTSSLLPSHDHGIQPHNHPLTISHDGSHVHNLTSHGGHTHLLTYQNGGGQTVWYDYAGAGGGVNAVVLRQNQSAASTANYWYANVDGAHNHDVITAGSHNHTGSTVGNGGTSRTDSTGGGTKDEPIPIIQPSLPLTPIIKV